MAIETGTFSLFQHKMIEVMMAAAIIGVLAIIAIPIFDKYKDKACIMHVLGAHEEVKRDMAEYFALNGKWPADKETLDRFVSGIWGSPRVYIPSETSQILLKMDIEDAAVHYRLKDGVLDRDNARVTLRPAVPAGSLSGPFIWVCTDNRDPGQWRVSGKDRTSVPDEIISRFLQ